jgi:hypothetical protein
MPHRNPALEAKIVAMVEGLDEEIRTDLVEAVNWARETLTNHEGRGHFIVLAADSEPGMLHCSFAKPSWSADHCGEPREEAPEAIVRAVCEYLCGA